MKHLKMIGLLIACVTISFKGVSQISPLLKVGDKAPDVKAFKWIKGKTLDHFEKGKVYVVEFGSTWCKPCAEMIPHLNEIAKTQAENVEVLGLFVMELNREKTVTAEPEYVKGVRRYVEKQGDKMSYNLAVDDPGQGLLKTWLKAAGKDGIPVTFVIDRQGMIAWIGNSPEALAEIVKSVCAADYNLADFVRNSEAYLAQFTPFNYEKLLLVDGNGGADSAFMYRSVLTRYKGDIPDKGAVYVNNWKYALPGTKYENLKVYQGRVQETGASLATLYYMAYSDTLWNTVPFRNPVSMEYPDTIKEPFHRKSYGKYWYKAILEMQDKDPFTVNYKTIQNRYNYSLKIPVEKASSKELQAAMRRDLMTYFGYDVKVETRLMPCWKLTVENKNVNLSTKSPGQKFGSKDLGNSTYLVNNAKTQDLIWRMAIVFSPIYVDSAVADEAPFLDFTGITGDIDYTITQQELEGFKSRDWTIINAFFKRLGLKWVKEKIPMKVVVIRDPVSTASK